MNLRSTMFILKIIQKDALKSQKLDKNKFQTCQNLSSFSKKMKTTIQLINLEIKKVNKLFKNIFQINKHFQKFKK